MIVSARAYSNNEVAFISWDVDAPIPGCLGFEVTRIWLDDNGAETDRVRCATWVGFVGQGNPRWIPQDSGIWPIQKLSWRDLTLRKRRRGLNRRPDDVRVRYEIRPVGDLTPGLPPAPDPTPRMVRTVERDANGDVVLGADGRPKRIEVPAYTGPSVTWPML